MNAPIIFIDRATGEKKAEKIYHDKALYFLYKKKPLNRFLAMLTAYVPLSSFFYGFLQNLKRSRKKIAPFIEKYEVNTAEFEKNASEFESFNDFFTRKLKPEARPIVSDEKVAIIPADGRFLFYQDISACDGFVVKGSKFSLERLLKDRQLSRSYEQGSMALGRLCPTDYHRFHFPVSCTPGESRLINGPLYSVSPVAVKQNIHLLAENKRMITELNSDQFGKILFIEVGATCVGSIHQTFHPFQYYKKGDEKGFFSFGGSSIILLFEQNRIEFDIDILNASSEHIEILCLMGQSMGKEKKS